jgi:nitrite reductase/ring-hydroxylating ferredoxin subunit
MIKKSFNSLIQSLKLENFKFSIFEFEEIGDYAPEDSDWNYKDITHTTYIHKDVEAIQASIMDDLQSSINLQKISLLGITIPLSVVNYEYDKFNQIYFTSTGPFIVIGNTVSAAIKNKRTSVKTTFAVGSRGFFSFFNFFIKRLIVKNHKKLMSEDLPMRIRRGKLRENNHSFYNPKKSYSFSFSKDINRSNLFYKDNSEIFKILKEDILKAKDNSYIGENIGIYSYLITKSNSETKVWPSTCPHEGAMLDKKCLKENSIQCPWHGRKIQPLFSIDSNGETRSFPNIDYAVKEEGVYIKIKFRNNPEYYDKKPYKFLNYED